MIKLYVGIYAGCDDDSREYEISDELAEFLRIKAWGDYVDQMEEEDKVCDEIEMEISNEEVEAMICDKGVPEPIANELRAIDDDASSAAHEMCIGYIVEENPPDEWNVSDWLSKDLESGLFKPSQSFEQFLEEEGWDPSDEDYDEEEAQDEYHDILRSEYEDCLDELPPYERAERYELDDFIATDYVNYGYTFNFINKAAEE